MALELHIPTFFRKFTDPGSAAGAAELPDSWIQTPLLEKYEIKL
jgi:hypothetical protein